MPTLDPVPGTTYYLWHYLPSLPLAIVFLLLFFLPTIYHIHLTHRTKTHFNWP